MHRRHARVLLVAPILLALPCLLGAERTPFDLDRGSIEVLATRTVHTAGTGTGNGPCSWIRADDGSNALACSDDGDGARADDRVGCLARTGAGFCVPGRTLYQDVRPGQFAIACTGGETFLLNTADGGGGTCTVRHRDDRVLGASCADDRGNRVTVDCSLNDDEGACTHRTGTASCRCVSCE